MKIIRQTAILLALGCSLTQGQEVSSIYGEKCANCHGADGSGNTEFGSNSQASRPAFSRSSEALRQQID